MLAEMDLSTPIIRQDEADLSRHLLQHPFVINFLEALLSFHPWDNLLPISGLFVNELHARLRGVLPHSFLINMLQTWPAEDVLLD